MRTTKLILALLASVAIAPCAYAQMNKHDKSIAAYNYNIAIATDDTNDASSTPLNVELDRGTINENGAPMQPQAQAPTTPYQNIEPAAASPANTSMMAAPPQWQDPNAAAAMMAPATAIQVGAQAPDFTLPRTQGAAIGLKDILAKGPAGILFTRGSSCGFCVTQMQLLQKNQAQFAALGIQTIAVSPEPLDSFAKAQQRFGLTYTLLSDYNSQVAQAYGLTVAATPATTYPALISIDATGKVVDIQTQKAGVNTFNLTEATNPLRTAQASMAPVAVPTSPATAVPSTQVAPAQQPANAMPPVPSPQAGKVKFDVPPSNPNFGKIDPTKSIAI